MKKQERVQLRTTKGYKSRLEKAARSRGLTVTAYIMDRMESHIRADLNDLRELLKEEDQMALV